MKDYTVYVYNYIRRSGKNRPLAYTRYQGEGACIHKVTAENGRQAGQRAVDEHLKNSGSGHPDLCLMGSKK